MHYLKYKVWFDTKTFNQPGILYKRDGLYCPFPEGSLAYDEFWDEQEHYIHNGFVHEGQRISGLHFLYQNYCPIWNKRLRDFVFPDFRVVDAEWFLAIEKDLALGPHKGQEYSLTRPVGHVDAKTRQCGHSLKAVVPLLYYMNFIRGTKNYIGAIEETYATKTLKMYLHYHDHLYEHTDLGKGWLEKTKNKYYKTGYHEKVNGQLVEKGFLSELRIVTFQDTTEKGVGGGCDLFLMEESGLFPDVIDACNYIADACKDGDVTTGNILVYGAAGNLKNCKQYSQLCENPEDYGFAGYPNVHEKGKEHKKVAYFIPNHACRPPHIDEDGNPDSEAAIVARDQALANLKKKDFAKWAQKVSQQPNNIREMFDLRGNTRYVKEILQPHLDFLRAREESVGTRVVLFPDTDGTVKYSLSVPDEMQPITKYPHDQDNTEGCVLIYEFPPPVPAYKLFIAGIDSYNQDDASTTSLGSIFIYKQTNTLSGETGGRYLVAEYVGRPKQGKHEFYRKCLYLLRLYNAVCMVENEDPEITGWFYNQQYDYLLADQPDIIRNIIPGTTVKRTKGIHAVTPLIIAAENKIGRYLMERIGYHYNEEGEVIGEKLGVTRIPSIGLLEELIRYVHDDSENYDRVRAFGWLLMYEEEILTKPVEENYDPNIEDFLVGTNRNKKRA